MRSTTAFRTVAAGLFAGGALTLAATAPASAGVPAVEEDIQGTVVSPSDLQVREDPNNTSRVVAVLARGTHDRVECRTTGPTVADNPYWYWLEGAKGWANAEYVDTRGRSVPDCTDPCPYQRCTDPLSYDGTNQPLLRQPWLTALTPDTTPKSGQA
ncbi:SH3 domain-containing protein [Streptomyces sp. PSKA54]|uniref:SH3 domain-containing protein n=1 Tax=Streptomyces himalayensis subsp. aureolus TaxID=2758039 RepID=A0A7W2HEM5_9ACTN|nr:SH3 domain-containing protein [Streptomyces himalayensis]MBA4861047.1 SH3 domain-containing protein [Streptomyces himalayensis subsp. aureolus]